MFLFFACENRASNKPEILYDSTGNEVEEKYLMSLGGVKQYIEITGKSKNKPVLLFIHGGPGWPQTPQLRYFNSDLTKTFILATWDQRGCGKTYLNDSLAENLTLAQIVSDAHELTQFLKQTFKQKKIFLAGFSWGSNVGLTLAQKYPEDYLAYVGISQVVNMKSGMEVTQAWLAERAKERNDTATLKVLERLRQGDTGLCNNRLDCFVRQYELVTKYNGAVFNPKSDQEVEKQ